MFHHAVLLALISALHITVATLPSEPGALPGQPAAEHVDVSDWKRVMSNEKTVTPLAPKSSIPLSREDKSPEGDSKHYSDDGVRLVVDFDKAYKDFSEEDANMLKEKWKSFNHYLLDLALKAPEQASKIRIKYQGSEKAETEVREGLDQDIYKLAEEEAREVWDSNKLGEPSFSISVPRSGFVWPIQSTNKAQYRIARTHFLIFSNKAPSGLVSTLRNGKDGLTTNDYRGFTEVLENHFNDEKSEFHQTMKWLAKDPHTENMKKRGNPVKLQIFCLGGKSDNDVNRLPFPHVTFKHVDERNTRYDSNIFYLGDIDQFKMTRDMKKIN